MHDVRAFNRLIDDGRVAPDEIEAVFGDKPFENREVIMLETDVSELRCLTGFELFTQHDDFMSLLAELFRKTVAGRTGSIGDGICAF